MKNTVARLAVKHAKNSFAEALYINNVADITRPVAVYGIVNERCNYKCRYCEYWRLKEYKDEMSIEQWMDALKSLKDYLGSYHIEFSGGEPFIKKGFIDLIEFCHANSISWGVTTNGSALNEKMIKRVIAAKPFNINISIDSHIAEVHNYARGIENSLGKITNGLEILNRERKAAGLDFPIMIKPVVHKLNFKSLPEMVPWAQEVGGTAINFQPIDRWTQETYNELWIEEDKDMADLQKVVDELLRQKRAGAPILNSELTLNAWCAHFREESATPDMMPCRVGLRNYFIRPEGNVEVCWSFPPIGNVKENPASEIWAGEAARQRRKETTECDRLCLFTCLSQKTMKDKVKMGLTLFKDA